MLPDLRVLIFATVSTFFVTVGAGLFASARLLPEPMTAQPDRDTPISRISLSWQDISRAPLREMTPAALNPDTDQPVASQPKIEDRPIASTPVSPASPGAGADQTIAVKSEPSDTPATTGAITETPAASLPKSAAPPRFAARPEPVDETTHALPAASNVNPPVAQKSKAEHRAARRQRSARQSVPATAPAAESAPNFFSNYGTQSR